MNKVLIATSCRAENARFVDFYRMRDDLIIPAGSQFRLFPGFFPEYSINEAANIAIQKGFSHLFIMDDDQILPPDTLMRLLEHDLPIVSCNLLTRTPPFGPYIFQGATENGAVIQVSLDEIEGPLVAVNACGMGGTLINTEVLAEMKEPWFTHNEHLRTYDLYFCHEARKLGYPIHVDLSCPSGHIVISSIWPNRVNDKWKTTLVVANAMRITIPSATREKGQLVIKEGQVNCEVVSEILAAIGK